MQLLANLQLFPFPGDEFYVQNVWNHCRCKYDPSISRIFKFILGWFLVQLCAAANSKFGLFTKLFPVLPAQVSSTLVLIGNGIPR